MIFKAKKKREKEVFFCPPPGVRKNKWESEAEPHTKKTWIRKK